MARSDSDTESRIASLVQLRTRGMGSPTALAQIAEKWSLSPRQIGRLDREARRRIQLAAQIDASDEVALSLAQRREFLQRAIAAEDWRLAEQIRERLDRQLRLTEVPQTAVEPDAANLAASQLARVIDHLAPLYADAPPQDAADAEVLAQRAALEILQLRVPGPAAE